MNFVKTEQTLSSEIPSEQWEQNWFNSIHILDNQRLAKPDSQLQGSGEVCILGKIENVRLQKSLNMAHWSSLQQYRLAEVTRLTILL